MLETVLTAKALDCPKLFSNAFSTKSVSKFQNYYKLSKNYDRTFINILKKSRIIQNCHKFPKFVNKAQNIDKHVSKNNKNSRNHHKMLQIIQNTQKKCTDS